MFTKWFSSFFKKLEYGNKNPQNFGNDGNQKSSTNSNSYPALPKGETKRVTVPNLGSENGYKVTQCFFKPGEIVQVGAIVGVLENSVYIMEFESFCQGRIVSQCPLKQKLQVDDTLFVKEGYKESPEYRFYIKNKVLVCFSIRF